MVCLNVKQSKVFFGTYQQITEQLLSLGCETQNSLKCMTYPL